MWDNEIQICSIAKGIFFKIIKKISIQPYSSAHSSADNISPTEISFLSYCKSVNSKTCLCLLEVVFNVFESNKKMYVHVYIKKQ